jgi:hypothetical protein
MKDVILWTAVFGPFVLGLIVLGFALWEAKRTPAKVHEQYAAIDDELRRAERGPFVCDWNSEAHRFCGGPGRYDVAHGKTLSRPSGTSGQRPRLLRPSATPDQSGDSRRRGDC